MNITKLMPNLMVEDVNHTLDYYCNILGLEFVMGVAKNSQEPVMPGQEQRAMDFAMLQGGNLGIMLQSRSSLSQEVPMFKDIAMGASVTLYIEVDNIEGLYDKLKRKVTLVKELNTTFYGMKEFYVKDYNSYILTFTQKT